VISSTTDSPWLQPRSAASVCWATGTDTHVQARGANAQAVGRSEQAFFIVSSRDKKEWRSDSHARYLVAGHEGGDRQGEVDERLPARLCRMATPGFGQCLSCFLPCS